jgi:phosphate-selective porin
MRPRASACDPNCARPIRPGCFDGLERGGIEAAWQRANWLLQGEWQYSRYDVNGGDRSLRGGYVQGSWTVHGARRVYKDGVFGTPKAVSGLGQVELALRYSQIDLPLAAGGERRQDGWSLGANLQYGPFLRFMVDRHEVDRDRGALGAELWSVRAAFMF